MILDHIYSEQSIKNFDYWEMHSQVTKLTLKAFTCVYQSAFPPSFKEISHSAPGSIFQNKAVEGDYVNNLIYIKNKKRKAEARTFFSERSYC